MHHEQTADPWWADAVPDLAHVTPPAGYADAWSFTAPVIDMPVYLDWLRDRLEELGGTLDPDEPASLPQTERRGGQLLPASVPGALRTTSTCDRCAGRSCS